MLTAVIGLAAQESLKDLFAGVELQLDPPFREGDWISVGEENGVVESPHLMNSRLHRRDGSTVTLPNNPVADNPLVLVDPAPNVLVTAYEDSLIRYGRRGWELPDPVRELKRRQTKRDPAHPTGVEASLTAELLRRRWLFAQLDPAQVRRLTPGQTRGRGCAQALRSCSQRNSQSRWVPIPATSIRSAGSSRSRSCHWRITSARSIQTSSTSRWMASPSQQRPRAVSSAQPSRSSSWKGRKPP